MESEQLNNPLAEDIRAFSRFGPTISSTIRTLSHAVLLPLLLMIIAWEMSPAYELMTLKGSVHHAIWIIVPILFMSMLLLHTFRVGGLAEKHFGWSHHLCCGIHSGMLCVVWLVLPLKFFCEALDTFQNGAWYDSLGRLFFVATLVAMSIGLYLGCRGFNRWRDQVWKPMDCREPEPNVDSTVKACLTAAPSMLICSTRIRGKHPSDALLC